MGGTAALVVALPPTRVHGVHGARGGLGLPEPEPPDGCESRRDHDREEYSLHATTSFEP